MKKVLVAISTALLIVILALTFAGCGKSGQIKSAFKKAGYEITAVAVEDSKDLSGLLKTDEQKELINKYEVFTCKRDARVATIIKFPSLEIMEEVLGEKTFETKTDDGYINGDCYFVSGSTDALYVFKNA